MMHILLGSNYMKTAVIPWTLISTEYLVIPSARGYALVEMSMIHAAAARTKKQSDRSFPWIPNQRER